MLFTELPNLGKTFVQKALGEMKKPIQSGSKDFKFYSAVILLGFIYLLQTASPLRLNFDAVDFFRMAVSWSGGSGLYPDDGTARYPIGYPIFLGILAGNNCLNSFTVVFSNVLFLFIGLFFFLAMANRGRRGDSKVPEFAVLATLLSWVVVKHSTLGLSDLPFFASSLATLLFFRRCETSQTNKAFAGWFALGLVGVVVSLLIRHVGFCLIPPLVWLVFARASNWLPWRRYLDRGLACLGIIAFVFFYFFMACGFDLLPMPPSVRSVYFHNAIFPIGVMRLTDLGCAALNLNPLRIPAGEFIKPVALLIGVAVLCVCTKKLFPQEGRVSAVWVYLATYLCLIFVAPWDDPRYLMPVLPLVLLAVFGAFEDFSRCLGGAWSRVVVFSWAGCYVGMGALALAYSTWLTFSGPEFANRFGSSESRVEYLYFYGGKSLEEVRENPRAYEMYKILDRFEPSSKGILK